MLDKHSICAQQIVWSILGMSKVHHAQLSICLIKNSFNWVVTSFVKPFPILAFWSGYFKFITTSTYFCLRTEFSSSCNIDTLIEASSSNSPFYLFLLMKKSIILFRFDIAILIPNFLGNLTC